MAHTETEIKLLIHMPPLSSLASLASEVWHIRQDYLKCEKGTHRVRRVDRDGQPPVFWETTKLRLNALSCLEDEKEITEDAYLSLLAAADPARRPIVKTRYRMPFEGHIAEIDIFPFWTDRALLEIEFDESGDQPPVPPMFRVIKDVTQDARYKNTSLAREVPYDPI